MPASFRRARKASPVSDLISKINLVNALTTEKSTLSDQLKKSEESRRDMQVTVNQTLKRFEEERERA